MELLEGEGRPQEHRDEQVGPGGRLPAPSQPPPSRCLMIGHGHQRIGPAGLGFVEQVPVGRVELGEPAYLSEPRTWAHGSHPMGRASVGLC